MAWLRRSLRAARARPAIAVAAVLVVAAGAATGAALVTTARDDPDTAAPATTSTSLPATTTAPPPSTTTTTTSTPATTTSTVAPTTTLDDGQRCIVRLHGKGGDGAPTYDDGDVRVLTPAGNDEAWGGLQWLYFPNGRYNEARRIVADAIDEAGCERVIVNGFSNGAAFAAKLYCRGETFGVQVVRYVVDDPVPDAGVDGCRPDESVDVTLYWTGALEGTAQPGWDCDEDDWTCEGGETIGIDAYADALGTEILASRFTDHNWYQDAPELSAW